MSELSATLDEEKKCREMAAAEAEARLSSKLEAEEVAGKLKAENTVLVQRLIDLKAREAERLNEINKMHEELLSNAKIAQVGTYARGSDPCFI